MAPLREMAIISFLAAIFTASLSLGVLFAVVTIGSIWGQVSGGVIASDVAMVPFLAAIVAVLVVLPAAPLTAMALLLARLTGARGYFFWSCAGVVIATACATLVSLLLHVEFPAITDDGAYVTFAAQWLRVMPFSVAAGLLGGVAFEWIDREATRRAERSFSNKP